MVQYDPKSWIALLIHSYSRRVVRLMMPSLIFMGVYTALISYVVLEVINVPFKSTTQVHSILGIVLGLFLVFRMNSAYARWWEGRTMWGSLVNNTRNLAQKLNAALGPEHQAYRDYFMNMIPNFPYALKEHLREGVKFEEIVEAEPGMLERLQRVENVPNIINAELYKKAVQLKKEGIFSEQQLYIIDKELKEFTDVQGACERIKNTPIPYSYSMYIKKFIFTFVITLPFGFVTSFSYFTIPIVMLLFYILVSIELIAEEIEDPFGNDVNDLPTDVLAEKIRTNVREIFSYK